MKMMQASYSGSLSSPPDSGNSYKAQLTKGRCVLHGIVMSSDAGNASLPQIKFSTGNDYTDIRCQITSPVSPGPAGDPPGYHYASGTTFDIPGDGILFEDGIYFEGLASTTQVTVFFSGGAKAS
jgi:hypothetical protein